MNRPLRTLIVDDEPLAREGISSYVARTDLLTEVGQARSGMEAFKLLEDREIDLLLLDIQMPGLSGTELIRALRNPPAVIFTTAHPDFAMDGFDLNAVDYLLKPIAFPRFLRAVLKARRIIEGVEEPTQAAPEQPDDLFLKVDGKLERIAPLGILYAESMQNYCRIFTDKDSYLPLLPLKELLEALPQKHFFQIHRTCVVQLGAIAAIDGNQVRAGGRLLPVSRSRKADLLKAIGGDHLG